MKIAIGLVLLLFATALYALYAPDGQESAAVVPPAEVRFAPAELVGEIEKKSLNEASGMAASRISEDVLWLINDSGNKPKLFAMGIDGAHLGTVDVEGIANRDWEDLASFMLDGKPWLMIADTGDNRSRHAHSALFFVPEPQPEEDGRYDGKVKPAWIIRFQYEDGPRDCESVAVDAVGEEVLLLSKRTVPPVLYSLPVRPGVAKPARGPAGIVVARRLGAITSIPGPSAADIINDPMKGPYRSQPTGMDITASGDEVAVMTYGDVYRYPRVGDEPWHDAMQRAPQVLRKPASGQQTEALAYSQNAGALYYTSEDKRAPIYRYLRQ